MTDTASPMVEMLRTLYRCSDWANRRVLDAVEQITEAGFLTPIEGGSGSVRDTLVHTMQAQMIWLYRARQLPPPGRLNPAQFPSVDAVRTRWQAIQAETAVFIAELDEMACIRKITYVNNAGERWTYPIWQMLLHQANHATQHRSEIAVALTQLGHSPGELDLLLALDEEANSAGGG